MQNEPVHDLTKAIAQGFNLSFIGFSSGELEEDRKPFPWVSFMPACLREQPQQFLYLLAALGEWNSHNTNSQWVYRPEEAADQTLFTVYCLLEPMERNPNRDPQTLAKLQDEMQTLARFLHSKGKGNIDVGLDWLYPRPTSDWGEGPTEQDLDKYLSGA